MATWYGVTIETRLDPAPSDPRPTIPLAAWHGSTTVRQQPHRLGEEAPARSASTPQPTLGTGWYDRGPKGAAYGKGANAQRQARTQRGPEPARKCRRPPSAAAVLRASRADPLAGAFAALRRTVRASRGERGEEERRNVRVIMAGMSLEEQQRAARDRVLVGRLSSHRVSVINQYEAYCMSKGKPAGVYPITEAVACGFLTWSVFKEGRAVSTHALAHYLSNLRVAAQEMGQWAVAAKGESALTTCISQLQDTCPSMPQRTERVPIQALVAACARARREGTLPALQRRAMVAVSNGALARGTEVGGDGGMRWGDLVLDWRGMAFKAYFCKTGHKSLAARVRVCPHMPKDLEEICPVRCLTEFREAWTRAGGKAGPKDLVWCEITQGGLPTEASLGSKETQGIIKSALMNEGVDRKMVSDHWARHSGRGMLAHDLELGEDAADLMGDWKPKEKRGGSKSTGQKHYAHATPDEAWAAAAAHIPDGFAKQCCKRKS